ncbi:alpha-L-rhamnosidase [Cohnella sp. CIP 111063]|uniref:glycoside hydrolase family 78 protein n=1 Tax=unclassified Cohnella TaxID=2636738 RepID=UPI000B8C6434|nr:MULTISPECIES: glycoside hydrolase family 78 protein [unclassified Cohnella]OXS53885.1 alpha-L-rhamnosidase [Cohnella sp. CIP 111063]PRX62470.1 alpha-L-rhamnosidase [Cohnella sp. SGD-V74]
MRITQCLTEYAVNPQGLHVGRPRLFWKMEADTPACRQKAYRIVAASSPERLDGEVDLWDSGKVESDRSVQMAYEGKPLGSGQIVYWKVRVWDQDDRPSDWSGVSTWTMGLLHRSEWKGMWIGRKREPERSFQPAPYFRKTTTVAKPVRRATAYAMALGVYEIRVNGARIGDRFAPGWTDYDKRVQAQAYEITDQLVGGENVIGIVVGDGWYAGTVGFLGKGVYGERPFVQIQIAIEYEDGSSELIVTDRSWRTSRGPIVYSDMIKGEEYDARLELDGWDAAGYDDSAWEEPDIRPGYNGLISETLEPPIRVTQTIAPVSVRRTERGTCIFDMGQNMVGWAELRVSGEAGTRVTLSYAEMLNPDGSLYLDNLRAAVQQDHYILSGRGEERYEPHFTFHGFRYVELIGYPGEPGTETLSGKVVHSDTPEAGELETSDEMINQLYRNITWSQRGNFFSVPTDCPQRDERLGWTGDAQIFARTASYNRDVSRFFTKYIRDMTDSQQPSGAFTDVAPDAGWIRHKMWNSDVGWFAPDNAGWGDAGVIIPWTLYLMYGDERILQTNYEAMRRWIVYLQERSERGLRPDYANYGDWLSIDAETPKGVLATAYFAYSTSLFSRIAGIVGNEEDRVRFESLFDEIAASFRDAYVSEDGKIKGETQTVYVLALQFGLLAGKQRRSAINHLEADIRGRGDRLSTGFLGVGYLLPVLTDNGRADLAYRLLKQEQFPSWMYSIRHGATTIWERWDGWTSHNGFQNPGMNSFNHYSLGSVGEWMFRCMAGIDADPDEPGFKRVVIRPRPGGGLSRVKASFESLYGLIEVEWTLSAEEFRLRLVVPVNASATVELPGRLLSVESASAAVVAEEGRGPGEIRVQSGRHEFVCALAQPNFV